MISHFVDDDPGYLKWVEAHPDGFVVNTYRKPSASYLIVHLAACKSIKNSQTKTGRWTTGAYSKICATDVVDLEIWARSLDRALLHRCGLCKP